MKLGGPWNVRGVRAQTRDTAREAARRAGMSLGDWLNETIIERAADEGIDLNDSANHEVLETIATVNERLASSIERLDQRLNNLTAQPAPAPMPLPSQAPATNMHSGFERDTAAEMIARLERRIDDLMLRPQMPAAAAAMPAPPYPPAATTQSAPPGPSDWTSGIDQAFAEISRRQRALEDDQAPAPVRYEAALPTRHDAPPPKWTAPAATVDLSGLETQLRNITAQIEGLNHSSAIEAALSGLRADLSEITRSLTEAMPRQAIEALENEMRKIAERLTESHHQSGLDIQTVSELGKGLIELREVLRMLTPLENLAGFDEAVRGLAHKIDAVTATHDTGSLQQIELAITTLRGLVSQVASDETLGQLADEVRSLSGKVDQVARSATVSAATEQNLITPQLEAQLRAFTEQLQLVQRSHGDSAALSQLQERIAALSSKIEASDARLNQLDAIERGLKDLMGQLHGLRSGESPQAQPVKAPIEAIITRTQDSLEDVHGTIDHVVDRLAPIESGMRDNRSGAAAPPAVKAPSQSMTTARPAKSAQPMPTERRPINPDLPPDFPLEPGSRGAHGAHASPAERIAASQEAIADIKRSEGASAGGTNFIAAARRAAQAAAPAEHARDADENDAAQTSGKTLSQRMRSLIAGASVILLVVGLGRVVFNLLDTDTAPVATSAAPASKMVESASTPPQPVLQEAGAGPLSLSKPDSISTATATPTPAPTPRIVTGAAPAAQPKIVSVPAPGAEQTGSIPAHAPLTPATSTAVPSVALPADKFPEALRKAAASGDPAAQYEVAARYLEGRGVTASASDGVIWLERAAKAGLAPAQFRLGSAYEKGQGVKKSLETARTFYMAAAEKGNAKAMHNIAVLHAEGVGGKPDYKAAAFWFRKAADYGIADSQYNLAILHARGVGVPQNLAESYKWFALAAAQGDKDSAKKRDDVAGRLDADSLNSAKAAVDSFVAERQPAEAATVRVPEGGWERAAGDSPKPKAAPRSTAGPMKLGAL